ncbi:MAG: hypothetical protein K2X39_04520 [Silvanigrellaceae bacterium]|nr:hypothetical protein [Silvanigrellaceae bacterium]
MEIFKDHLFLASPFFVFLTIGIIVRKQPFSFLLNAGIFFIIFHWASFFILAIPDSNYYIQKSFLFNSVQNAFWSLNGAAHLFPITGLLYSSRSLLGDDFRIYIPFINCFCVSAFLYSPSLCLNNWRWHWNYKTVLMICALFAMPSFISLAVSASKDLVFILYFLCFVFSSIKIFNSLIYKFEIFSFLISILVMIISIQAIKYIRNYMHPILLCGAFIGFFSYLIVIKMNKLHKKNSFLNINFILPIITIANCFLLLGVILYLKIDQITSSNSIYIGASQINEILYFKLDVNIMNPLFLSFYSIFTNFTVCFYDVFNNFSLEYNKKLVCLFEGFIFLFLFFSVLFKKEKNIIDCIILAITIIHITIITWAAPNLGALLRYRLMEVVIMVIYIAGRNQQEKLLVNKNKSL